jgi:hypothetical protein
VKEHVGNAGLPGKSYIQWPLKLLVSSFGGSECRIKSTEDPEWISMIINETCACSLSFMKISAP